MGQEIAAVKARFKRYIDIFFTENGCYFIRYISYKWEAVEFLILVYFFSEG
jgi:hypothetical protein